MKTSRVRTFCLLAAFCLLTLVPFARAQHAHADGVPQTYHGLVGQYFDSYFHFNPSAGTAAGLHQHDTQLEDASAASTSAQISSLHSFQKKFAALDASALDANDAADLQILTNNINSQLLSLEVIRNFNKIPTLTPPASLARSFS